MSMNEGPVRIPKDGTFELTVRCNLHCKMCLFRHDDSENASICRKELTAGEWIDMARQVAEAGTFELLITGGEPMLRPDFCEIWEDIYKQGFIITLYTNATLVTDRIMETLRKYPPHVIGVTIYGAGPETYKKVTGSAEAFEGAIEGIRKLRTLPSRLDYRMTVIQDNHNDIDAVNALIRREFDPTAEVIMTRMIYKSVRGACADVDKCRIPAEKNIEFSIERTIKAMKDQLGDRFGRGQVELRLRKQEECREPVGNMVATLFGCNAGMKSYTVSWDGKLLGCQMMEAFATEIKGDFKAAWRAFPYGVELPPVSEKCQTCPNSEFCYLCPAVRYAETGTLTEAAPYICKDAEATRRIIDSIKTGEYKEKENSYVESVCKTGHEVSEDGQ